MKQKSVSYFLLFLLLPTYLFASNATLTFPDACVKGESIQIALVGDVLLHQPLQIKASQIGFESLWEEAIPFIHSSNIAFANLEGPVAPGINRLGREVKDPGQWDNYVYTGFPLFNYPPSLVKALKNSGFDIVSTANNHVLDRHAIGIDKTLEALNKVGLAYTGTRTRGSNQSWVRFINKGGIKTAWIACTEMTNGIVDEHGQVLYCYKKSHREWIIQTIQALKQEVDAVIIIPHWGSEYEYRPNRAQINFAHQLLEAGAIAVIGSHPHVLQNMEKYETHDGRSTFILYSLGNFVSYQGSSRSRSTIILLLNVTKTVKGTVISGVRFVPMYMENRSGLHRLFLKRLTKEDQHSLPYLTIGSVLPMGNAIFSLDSKICPETVT